ncbi:patronin isoform X2 [Ceratitis capitata]|uniref:patronin isoform X2 n=1 Tax=Ceratitis capitata TaxID=7213 RepID=UPI0006188459|nr:patronin isoform X2 [Ceratitis capitata]
MCRNSYKNSTAHQRASVKWLLAKAFNNNVPDNIREPFYTDHDNQERLKPQIVVEMGNATLYCQTLSNIYSDPNYQSLNHWSILQTLSRKGVPVAESPEMPLTETVLIQTNPLRINAHMSVIQSLMTLYAKEITSGERIANAVARITGTNGQTLPHDQPFDQLLLLWISHACTSLKKRIAREVELGATDENGVRMQVPNIPAVHDYQSLCDGVCLALFISYYCPKALPWTLVRINYLPAVEDSIHNVSLVSNFCQKHLPYNVFHMNPEDVTYMRNSMKLNLVVLLADLFLLFEIHPAKCVCYPGMDAPEVISKRNFGVNEHGICHRRGLTMQPVIPIPDLRSDSDSNYGSPTNRPPFQVSYSASADAVYGNNTATLRNSENEAFVVHKSRGVTTLSSLHSQQHSQQQQQQQQEPLVPARLRQSKEKSNIETKADERGDYVPAGRPSNWEHNRRPSYAGRRSRRNSSSEDSQLTIENFGGSQDQLNAVGRFERERDRERDRERKLSNVSVEPAVAVRSSIADARGTLQLGYDTDSGSEKQDRETEKYLMKRHASTDNVNMHASNTQLNSIMSTVSSPMPTTRRQHPMEKDNLDEQYAERKDSSTNDYEQTLTRRSTQSSGSSKVEAWNNSKMDPYDDDIRTLENASKLSNIRMKLEEKRLRIEQDKRRIEMALLRHQEKLTREDMDTSSEVLKWETLSNDSNRTPDLDPLDLDKYQQSLAIMNMNLQDIQQDIQKLTVQQNQIQAQQLQAQQLMHAQHMANMLNQPPYGSQQHLSDNFNQMQMQQQQHNFGSTPHLAHSSFNPHANLYNSRPPSRDPYQQQQHHQQQQQQQQQMPSMPMQYINEHGQYVPQPQQPQQMPPMMQANYMQPQKMYNDNMVPYNNHVYGGPPPPQQPQYAPHHNQTPPQYMNRASMYDDYGRDPSSPQPNPMYPHEMSPQPTQPQRRTWNQSVYEQQQQQQYQHQQQQQQQQQQAPLVDVNAWQQQKQRSCLPMEGNYTWKKPNQMSGNSGREGFVLHQNDGGGEYQHLFRSSPQHMQHNSDSGGGLQRQHSVTNMPMTTKQASNTAATSSSNSSGGQQMSDDMMAPQSICFIGDEDDVEELERNIIESMQNTRIADYAHQQQQLQMQHQQQQQQHYQQHGSDGSYDGGNELLSQKLHITSGNLTYRIPSPSRPAVNANSFQDPRDVKTEKGFYISFDDNQPKRPKPPLRAKRSPKKERSMDSTDHQVVTKMEPLNRSHSISEDNNPTYNGGTLSHGRQFGGGNLDALKNGNKMGEFNTATYNKYTDAPIHLRHDDLNSQKTTPIAQPRSPIHQIHSAASAAAAAALSSSPPITRSQQTANAVAAAGGGGSSQAKALVIGTDVSNLDRESIDEMERRKEKIMLQSLQRRQQQEEAKARKEIEAQRKREMEREKEEEKARKKEEQMARRAAILEQHRLKKAIEEAEREGKTLDRAELNMKQTTQNTTTPRLRQTRLTRPRPKTIHVDDGSVDLSEASSISSRSKKGSSTNLTAYGTLSNSNTLRRDFYRGSHDSLTVKESPDEYPSTSSTPIGRRGSYKASREPTVDRGRSRISVAKGSSLNFRGRKSNSLMNLCDTDSGLGRATPPRRAPSPGMASGRHMPSPSGPGSLPPGLISKRRGFDDGSGLLAANLGSMEYSGPKLYKQPAAKSNRGIILNAVEYCVFPGAVNREAKQKVLEKIARSEAKHFLVLFRDAGCQFRALYSYVPEMDQVTKLYGTGPSQVDEVMFDKFFKYNSGGKCFSQVHTKHLTVTIDAFTIHNSLWQGKKVHLPSKKDMALVI